MGNLQVYVDVVITLSNHTLTNSGIRYTVHLHKEKKLVTNEQHIHRIINTAKI